MANTNTFDDEATTKIVKVVKKILKESTRTYVQERRYRGGAGDIPQPQVKYTVWSCVALNSAAWDYVRASP